MSKFKEFGFASLYENKKSIQVSSLIPAYLDMNPLAHPDCNSSMYSESGMEYFLMRLPKEISNVEKFTLTANTEILNKYKDLQNYKQVFCHKRKRLYYFSEELKHLVVGINSVSDIHDVVSILTGFLVEINKLRIIIKNCNDFLISFNSNHLNKLGKHYQFEAVALKDYLYKVSTINDFAVEMIDCEEKEYVNRAKRWGNWMKKSIENKVQKVNNVYVVFSNSHSVANVLSSYTRQRQGFLISWAKNLSKYKSLLKDMESGRIWQDDALYIIQRDYFDQNGKEFNLLEKENESSGIFRFNDKTFNGPKFNLIDLASLDPDNNDSRIFDNAILNIKNSGSILINIDFTMGGMQAFYILNEVIERFKCIKGLYIYGKAGAMEGDVGDIILPNYTYDYHKNNTIFYKNDLKSKYIRRYLRGGKILESHGMLTVPSVLLQSHKYLNYYFQQSLTGIEMEGGHYLESILFKINKKTFADKLINITESPFDFGIAYYISDTPYHEGKTIGTLGQAGVESVYALTIAVINRVLIKESCIEVS